MVGRKLESNRLFHPDLVYGCTSVGKDVEPFPVFRIG